MYVYVCIVYGVSVWRAGGVYDVSVYVCDVCINVVMYVCMYVYSYYDCMILLCVCD